ncbi:hypothetical protein [Rhizosphaericola mali]|uniref:Uncharacterized protein n=1 Tax=Rhizosphaericola mali TaxID=2545455 RepID=A0A5P2G4G7_9BACT|nr:hypothetical protein [Rhizosphaericola mali]QES90087.1 hypothetical protein E0W69_015995 [Rhizosphaericola mali]
MDKYLKIFFTLFLTSFSLLACGNKDIVSTKAKVVERRDVGNGKIRISYIFKADQTTIAGVKVIDNKVLNSDSIVIKYKKTNPQENELDF